MRLFIAFLLIIAFIFSSACTTPDSSTEAISGGPDETEALLTVPSVNPTKTIEPSEHIEVAFINDQERLFLVNSLIEVIKQEKPGITDSEQQHRLDQLEKLTNNLIALDEGQVTNVITETSESEEIYISVAGDVAKTIAIWASPMMPLAPLLVMVANEVVPDLTKTIYETLKAGTTGSLSYRYFDGKETIVISIVYDKQGLQEIVTIEYYPVMLSTLGSETPPDPSERLFILIPFIEVDLGEHSLSTSPVPPESGGAEVDFWNVWMKFKSSMNGSEEVNLTLFIHENDTGGPSIPGVTVTVIDSEGNTLERSTDQDGQVTMSGIKGKWNLLASRGGYCTKAWSQSLFEDTTMHFFIESVVSSSTSISDPMDDVQFPFVDITNIKVRTDCEYIVAEIQLKELPDQLVFNQAPESYLEYQWGIHVDIDGNPNTGATIPESAEGAEYNLRVMHFVPPSSEVVINSILGECQKDVWIEDDNSWRTESEAFAEMDYNSNTLTIRGIIPKLNANSRIWATCSYWDTESDRSKEDRAPDTGYFILPLALSNDVTLTLYIHENSASGPIISDATVSGLDGDGNAFSQITSVNGYVTIPGAPGTWTFTASKNDYQSKFWSATVSEDETSHVFLDLFVIGVSTISDQAGDIPIDTADIIHVSVFRAEDSLVAQIQVTNLPQQLVFNQIEYPYADYSWEIIINIDGNSETGSPLHDGAEYLLSFMHFIEPSAQVITSTLLDECQANVFQHVEEGGFSIIDNASVQIDYTSSTITLRGSIPGLNDDSRWWATATGWDIENNIAYVDRAPNTGYVGLVVEETNEQVDDVILNLYVHENSASGPIISDATVSGLDGDGNAFSQITSVNGYVTIPGAPGTWTFTATRSGYDSNSWMQIINVSETRHAYLVKQTTLPQITGITPSQPYAQPTRQWISIVGSGFISASQVTLRIESSTYLIPADRTQFVSETEIRVYVGLTDSGIWTTQITHTGGITSNIFSFEVFTQVNEVTLKLYVHENNSSGPVITGALVTGQDADGKTFSFFTDSSGYVTITGTPGLWSFSALKTGYETNSWSQSITVTETRHAYIVKQTGAPQVTGITPLQPYAQPTRQWITIAGSSFTSESQVTLRIGSSTYVIPADRTQWVSATEIRVYVGLTDAGMWSVQVTNLGGNSSNIFDFDVTL